MGSPLKSAVVNTVSMAPDALFSARNWKIDALGNAQGPIDIPVVETVDEGVGFMPLLLVKDIPGCLQIYSGFGSILSTSVALNPPFVIDWRIYLGTGGCNHPLFDDESEPMFAGSTIYKGAQGSQGGLLTQVGGSAADCALVCARVSGIPGATQGNSAILPCTLYLRCLPGLPGPLRASQAGSFIG